MAKLAIRGHATRGDEIIEILEILGGNNAFVHIGNNTNAIYYINKRYKNYIICSKTINACNYTIFTLEEFLEKFPYKIGSKIITKDKFIGTIIDIKWQGDSFFVGKEEGDIVYTVKVSTNAQITYQKEDLQPYKEETTEEELMPKIDFSKYCKNKYLLNMGDYEIKIENGKTYIVRKRTQYPKTYEECWYMLKHNINNDKVTGYKNNILSSLQKLLICRDAYWKIVGEQMGLGKPWELSIGSPGYYIYYNRTLNHIKKDYADDIHGNIVFAFPTEKMRDAFYENFKDLIEACKELL